MILSDMQRTTAPMLNHPQPLGLVSLPAGYLVLPPAAEGAAILDDLMHGWLAPAEQWPAAWQFYRAALLHGPAVALRTLATSTAQEAHYNRFVLAPSEELYHELHAQLQGELRELLDLVAYTIGLLAEPPAAIENQGEVAALILAAHASHALENGQGHTALDLLRRAAAHAHEPSPALEASLLLALAERLAQAGESKTALDLLRQITTTLDNGGPLQQQTRVDAWLTLALTLHQSADESRTHLHQAAGAYQKVLQLLDKSAAPQQYALAQANLALVYLAMPMTQASESMRMAVAVSALREALTVYTPAETPEEWAAAKLNLANALQYLPSGHPEQNLIQAIEIYEELLTMRPDSADPAGRARLLANQANALAHLGIFDHALAKLQDAYQLFKRAGEPELAASCLERMQAIAQSRQGG